jgi:hypothetical protein
MLCVFDGSLSVAVHESVHMSWALLGEMGIKVSSANDEPLAYLCGWMAQAVMEFLEEAA